MGTSFTTRVALKLKKIARDISPVEKEFRRVWPLIEPIEGWLLDGEENWLFRRALALPDGANLVEIGSYKGRSTCCLAFGCTGTNKRVFAVDPFDGGPDLPHHDSYDEFCSNIKRCGLTEYVEPIVGVSSTVAKGWSRPIHFLFIDGSHLYEDVMKDFASFFPYVVPGGTVAFHDVEPSKPGVMKAWNETIKPELTGIGYFSAIGYGKKPGRKFISF